MCGPGERAAQKRRAILAAARTVFMREGFGAGLDVIAAEADVSKVTIYNHGMIAHRRMPFGMGRSRQM